MHFSELLTYIVKTLLDPVKIHLNLEYVSKAEECLIFFLFRPIDMHCEHHIGSCYNTFRCTEYISKAKDCFNDDLFRVTVMHSEHHNGPC